MNEWNSRTELLIGKKAIKKLKNAHVLVVGLGGVGGITAEMLCRAGIGKLTLVDGDIINSSNRNRQIAALTSTINKNKTDVISERLKDINPDIKLHLINEFIKDEDMLGMLESYSFDYVVDAIDTLSPKINLIYNAVQLKMNIVSSMGSGGKLDPTQIQISDIDKSYNCHLARILRKHLHRLGVRTGVMVAFSTEKHNKEAVALENGQNQTSVVGTISYMPTAFACAISSVVIRQIIEKQ